MDSYRKYGRNSFNRNNQPMSCAISNNNFPKCNQNENAKSKKEVNNNLAYGYFKVQSWNELYCPSRALHEGTAFPCLNLIFCGSRGKM